MEALKRAVPQASDLAIWSIEFRDETGGVVAVSTVRVAIRPRRRD